MNQPIAITQLDYRKVLTCQEISNIEHECSQYQDRAAAAIDALLAIQRSRGWVNDDCLYAIAECLGMSAAQLEGVATFYNHIYRHPVGDHVIHLCNSISCWLADYQLIAETLKSELDIDFGETTADGKVTLLPNVCLGCCDKAPAMMLDGELLENLNVEMVTHIVRKLKEGNG